MYIKTKPPSGLKLLAVLFSSLSFKDTILSSPKPDCVLLHPPSPLNKIILKESSNGLLLSLADVGQ